MTQPDIFTELSFKPVRVLDQAESEATQCFTAGCEGKASFRVTRGAVSRDWCDACLDEDLRVNGEPVPLGEFPRGY